MRPKVLWGFALLAGVIGAGTSRAETTPLESVPTKYLLSDVTVELVRTPCFGTCPAYELIIRGSGVCTYSGRDFVRQKGDVEFHLDQKSIVDLLNEFYAAEFFRLRDKYLEGQTLRLLPDGRLGHDRLIVSDVPHLILTVRIQSYSKAIEMNPIFGPSWLLTLGDRIDSLANSSRWTKVLSR